MRVRGMSISLEGDVIGMESGSESRSSGFMNTRPVTAGGKSTSGLSVCEVARAEAGVCTALVRLGSRGGESLTRVGLIEVFYEIR